MGLTRSRSDRTAAVTWAGIAEICLAGTVLIWQTSANRHGGYGPLWSVTAVALAGLLTLVGVAAAFSNRLSARPKLVLAILLDTAAGGVLPLAISDLDTEGGGESLLLIQAVIGIVVLATHLMKTRRRSERDG
jgi:hypothetical protein